VDMDEEEDEDMVEVEEDHPLVLIVVKVGHVSIFCTKPRALSVGTVQYMEHATEYFPNLLKKWEEKKAHCNMVTAQVVWESKER
jgi:hypothetical protein